MPILLIGSLVARDADGDFSALLPIKFYNFFIEKKKKRKKKMSCPEQRCIKKTKDFKTMIEGHKHGNAMVSLHVTLVEHVPIELIEEAIDLAVDRYYDTIIFLCVSSHLPDRIGMKIAELIEKTTSLDVCNITHNAFSYRVMCAIFDALIRNKSLSSLALSSNACCLYGSDAEERIVHAFWLNPRLASGITIVLKNDFSWAGAAEHTQELRRRAAAIGHPTLFLLLQHYIGPRFSGVRRQLN